MTCDITIEARYNDKGVFCVVASTPKTDYAMPVNLDNLGDVVAMLNNAIKDIESEARTMIAQSVTINNQ